MRLSIHALSIRGRTKLFYALGTVAALFLTVAIVWRIPQQAPVSRDEQLAACKRNMERLLKGLEAYRKDHGGAYPLVLTKVLEPASARYEGLYPRYIRDENVYLCPALKPERRLRRPGYVPYTYRYEMETSPFLLKIGFPPAKKRPGFNKQLLKRFGDDTTILTCLSHGGMERRLLTIKRDGRIAWAEFGRDPQELEMQRFNSETSKLVRVGPSASAGPPPPGWGPPR